MNEGGIMASGPPDGDLYEKVIDIAQQQAQASASMAELHRQNVNKMETLASMLAAQTTSMVGISNALQQISEARARGAEEIKSHVTAELRDRERKVWVALIIIALTGTSDALVRIIGLVKPGG